MARLAQVVSVIGVFVSTPVLRADVIVTSGTNYVFALGYNSDPYGYYYSSSAANSTGNYANSLNWIGGGNNDFGIGYGYASQTVSPNALSVFGYAYGVQENSRPTSFAEGIGNGYDYMFFTLTRDYVGTLQIQTFASTGQNNPSTNWGSSAGSLLNLDTGVYYGGYQDAISSNGVQSDVNDFVFIPNLYLPAGHYEIVAAGYGYAYGYGPNFSYGWGWASVSLTDLTPVPEPATAVVLAGMILLAPVLPRLRRARPAA